MKRNLLVMLFALIFSFSSIITNASPINNILHEKKESKVISSGVTYEKWERLTEAGWVDVHILKVDLTNPYIELDVIRPEEFGSKKSLTTIGEDNNIIAGINGDFFSMADNPTDVLGFEYSNGEILSVKNNINAGYGLLGSLFFNNNNEPLIDFINITFNFVNKEDRPLYISGINKLTNIENPVIYYSNAMKDTSKLDELYPDDLYKIVVVDNKVTYVSNLGETVEIPENGYVITVRNEIAPYHLSHYPVGMEVKLTYNTNISLDNINMAISGAGKIIDKGQFIEKKGLLVQGDKRHPRSAIGYSEDKETLYAVVVDGRGSSIGVTHSEIGSILLDVGLYEAMHLDGGGSSTLIGRELGYDNLEVLNRPSDGRQRGIANGFGIISNAPKGTLQKIEIIPEAPKVFKNMPVTFKVIGYDEYYNPVTINEEDIVWQTSNLSGDWVGNTFYPHNEGVGVITCYVNGVKASINISSMDNPIHLELENEYIYLSPGDITDLKVVGVDQEGFRGEINAKDIQWTIENEGMGYFANGQFVAGDQSGYSLITGSIGETKVYGYVIVGHEMEIMDEFENVEVEAITYPETALAEVTMTNSEVTNGKQGIKLTYLFQESTETQAAYVQFKNPYIIDENVEKIGMWVKGEGTNHWLRGRIEDNSRIDDGNGNYVNKFVNITFAPQIDWNGWQYVEATLPKNVEYPIKLDRLYVVSLVTSNGLISEITFEHLTATHKIDKSELPLPHTKEYYDPMYKPDNSGNGFNVTVFGSTSDKNRILDDIVLREAAKQMDSIADVNLFAGNTDLSGTVLNQPKITWNNSYSVADYEEVRIMTVATDNKGIRSTDHQQWQRIIEDLNNTNQENIIIVMNNNPLKGFIDEREGELFHDILKDLRSKTGKNIFVINGSGYSFNLDIVEGIRYFDVNGLWYRVNENNNINLHETFYLINFNFDQEVTFDVIDLYPKITIE